MISLVARITFQICGISFLNYEDSYCNYQQGVNTYTCGICRISVTVPRGALVAIVGHVGSGKSSLLSAMLGETERRSGSVSIKVSIDEVKLVHSVHIILLHFRGFMWILLMVF